MRTIRIYQMGNYQVGDIIELSPEAAHHVAVVLRQSSGNELTLFCGDNREFLARITDIRKKSVFVDILSVKDVNRESSRRIHLAQGISKGDRMEIVIQKAVELGAASITPLITQRCVVKLDADRFEKKHQQWKAIAIAACEQSGRNQLPIIFPPQTIAHFLLNMPATLNFILNPASGKNWRNFEYNQQDIGLLIGPEGGLTDEEVITLQQHNFHSLQLGPRVLRTETAALVALSVLQAACGDL